MRILFAAAAILAASPAPAETLDPGWLDRLAEQRNEARRPGPPVALPPTPRETLVAGRDPWACMSVPAWTPILAKPAPGSPVVGYTQAQAAVSMRPDPAYVEVLLYNGKGRGYVPKAAVRPYVSGVRPGDSCTVLFRPNDSRPVFRYGPFAVAR